MIESGSIAKDCCYAFCHDVTPRPNSSNCFRRSLVCRAEIPEPWANERSAQQRNMRIFIAAGLDNTIYRIYSTIPYYFPWCWSRNLHRIPVIWKHVLNAQVRPDWARRLRGLCSVIATGRLNGAPRRDPRRSDDPLRGDRLLTVRAKRGDFGSPGFAGAGKTEPSGPLHPLEGKGNGITSSLSPDLCSFFVRAVRPFLRSRPTLLAGTSRAGIVKTGRHSCPCSCFSVCGRRLVPGPEHGGTLTQGWGEGAVVPRQCGQACLEVRSPTFGGANASWRLRSTA
jgi:hypothetical protein